MRPERTASWAISSKRVTVDSHPNSWARSRAPRPSLARRSRWRASSIQASTYSPSEWASTPVWLATTESRTPGASKASVGVPCAAASITTSPQPSSIEGCSSNQASPYRRSRVASSTWPSSSSPGTSRAEMRSASGPSPMMRSRPPTTGWTWRHMRASRS